MATAYKILGQSAPANTSNADLYTVPASTSTIVSTIAITNTTATVANATVYIRKAAAAAATGNAFVYTQAVPAYSTVTYTNGITLATTDVVTIATATANALTFQAFGSELS